MWTLPIQFYYLLWRSNMKNCSLIDWQTNGEIFVATTTSIFKDIGGETGNEFIT